MVTPTSVGVSTGGKPINLSQLQTEIAALGVALDGIGMGNDWIYPYDDAGQPADFTPQATPLVQQAVTNHVALRDKTDAELAAEFQASSDPQRKQDIRDMQAGLMPREQVPMT